MSISRKQLFKGLYRRCVCGCNKLITITDKEGRTRNYISGHNHIPKTREQCNLWKGGRVRDGNDYILIYRPDHPNCNNSGYIREHRLVMEEYLGRYLLPTEEIHHINNIRDDNRIENLQLLTKSEHASITHKGSEHNKKDMSNRHCRICNTNKTRIKQNKYEDWCGNEIDGWLCNRCYVKERRIIQQYKS